MALDKDILGLAIYNVRNSFSNKTVAQLEAAHGTLEGARLECAKQEAEAIINHFKATVVHVPGAGLTAPNGPVGGTSVTGKIQ
jgi:hypothetical protein